MKKASITLISILVSLAFSQNNAVSVGGIRGLNYSHSINNNILGVGVNYHYRTDEIYGYKSSAHLYQASLVYQRNASLNQFEFDYGIRTSLGQWYSFTQDSQNEKSVPLNLNVTPALLITFGYNVSPNFIVFTDLEPISYSLSWANLHNGDDVQKSLSLGTDFGLGIGYRW